MKKNENKDTRNYKELIERLLWVAQLEEGQDGLVLFGALEGLTLDEQKAIAVLLEIGRRNPSGLQQDVAREERVFHTLIKDLPNFRRDLALGLQRLLESARAQQEKTQSRLPEDKQAGF